MSTRSATDELEGQTLAIIQTDLTHYHEAGHAVAYYLLGFPPKLIRGAFSEHDRRSTAFLRTRGGLLQTHLARERVQDYAVAIIAGIAAESKFSGVLLADLRLTAGKGDYEAVNIIAYRLMLHRGFEQSFEVRDAYIQLWEARAAALMGQPHVWAAVESLAEELLLSDGVMGRADLLSAIRNGLTPAAP